MKTEKKIFFYRIGDEYGYLSNFAPYPITMNNLVWPTSEHYFQAQKFIASDEQEFVRNLSSPMNAARAGRDRSRPIRQDWDAVKNSVMKDALLAKFKQHPKLAQDLLATGNATLVEHTANDSYWADGGDGSGQNMLGKILMEVRAILKSQAGNE